MVGSRWAQDRGLVVENWRRKNFLFVGIVCWRHATGVTFGSVCDLARPNTAEYSPLVCISDTRLCLVVLVSSQRSFAFMCSIFC